MAEAQGMVLLTVLSVAPLLDYQQHPFPWSSFCGGSQHLSTAHVA